MSAYQPVRHASLTDVGVKRSHNQDACSAQPATDAAGFSAHVLVCVVPDLMGGHAGVEKASAKASRDIPFLYLKHARDGVIASLRRAFEEANAGIYSIGQENPEFRGMGTTATALVLRPEGAWLGHVGDSRAYRVRDGVLDQLTFDHSWVWEVAKRQGIDPDQLGDFKKNVIIRSLGPDPSVEVDIEGPHPVKPGDLFLLCSDGLSGQLLADELGAIPWVLPPDEAAPFLVDLANVRGGPDNITVVLVKVPGEAGDAAGADEPAARPGLGARLLAGWKRAVPWPFTVVGGGILLAGAALGLHASEAPGAIPLFLFAATLIAVGMAGMVMFIRTAADTPEREEDLPRELNIHKAHEYAIGKPLIDRLNQMERQLVELLKRPGAPPLDWKAYQKLCDAAEAELKKGDGAPAFRARCRAAAFIAKAYNRGRAKEEAFQPNWTTTNR